jgi:hypothetical protein
VSASIALPSGFTAAQAQAIANANPGIVLALPTPPGTVVPPDVHAQRILGWLDVLEQPLEAGEAIILPPPLGTFLAGLTKTALGLWRAKLTATPQKERWTAADMAAERDSLAPPKT